MRIIVIGGSGRTGTLVVEKLIAAGHAVVATIRNSKHMAAMVKRGAEAFVLDLDKSPLADFVTAMQGADAVVFAAGSAVGESSAIDRIGTRRTVHAAENAGVKRYLAISSIGASTGMSTRGFNEEMKDYYRQKRAAAKFIHTSGLAWTILEPGELTDEAGTGKVTLTEAAIEEGKVSRDDVAATVLALIKEPRTAGRTFQLVGGDTEIRKALATALKA